MYSAQLAPTAPAPTTVTFIFLILNYIQYLKPKIQFFRQVFR
jgi:hypothetical protein